MDREKFNIPTFLSCIYIYREMFYSVGFAHILCLCNAICRSAQTMEMMMSKRKRRGYLRTVTFESVHKTPHFIPYSSISVHCHTVNSLFRLPHSMLKVLYRNHRACHLIGKEEQ
jgi:hypothetical protein